MRNLYKATAAVSMVFILAACTKPTDTVIPTDASKWEGDFAQSIKSLPEADKALLAGYLMRAKLGEAFGGKPMPVGTTVGQALEDQKQFLAQKAAEQAAQEQLRKQVEQQKAAAAAELSKTITLAFLGQHFSPADYTSGQYDDKFIVQVAIKNASEKPIKGVKADFILKNTFGETITTTELNIEQTIAPGQSYTWTGARKLNKFIDTDQKLMTLEDGKFSTEMRPTMVVFSDGTTIGTP